MPSSPEECKDVPAAGLAPPKADPTGTDGAVECPQSKIQPVIFCDLDGVLVDFNRGIYRLLRKDASKLYQTKSGIKRLWSAVSRSPKFFEKLHWTSDGRELWQSIYHLQPDILTGVPNSKPHDVGREKYRWCQRELTMPPKAPNKTRRGHEANKKANENSQYNHVEVSTSSMIFNHIDMAARHPQRHDKVSGSKRSKSVDCDNHEIVVNVISCWSRYKHFECVVPGSILIDDRETLQADWERAGGVFVHHTDTPTTLRKLRGLGIPVKHVPDAPTKAATSNHRHGGKPTKAVKSHNHRNKRNGCKHKYVKSSISNSHEEKARIRQEGENPALAEPS